MEKQIQHINPAGMSKNPAFSQIVTTGGNGTTIYIGGQNAIDDQGALIGKGDLQQQTEQVMKNILLALAACNATFQDVVKLNIYIVQGQDPRLGFAAAKKYMGDGTNPPVVTVVMVAGLGNPDWLLEIEAVAFAG
ncbi:RidA family protein [Taibaiella koreensis]|uniref:RidA family protein n=1 Tax=Taibaiella koreensis TaxID=1268548 RepID=UPI000E59C889|nr:RidA family protein [Taibaiella koreensis]